MRWILTLLAIFCLSTPTLAAKKKSPKPSAARKPAAAKPKTGDESLASAMKFSDLKLKGQLKKPDLSYIYKRKGLRAEQIVNIPKNFNEQIAEGDGQF